ncbi:MAG TPA: thioredoxin family protein [Thermoanaerobaculia bacterium]|nr:thioredoxin family protein [Thermoanaerobaculia bacterium]
MTYTPNSRTRRAPAVPARAATGPLLLVLVALVALAALPAAAQMPSDAVFKDFVRTGDYILVVDGKEVPAAEIYMTQRVPTILILSSALPSPVLLSPRTQGVETVSVMKIAKQPDGTVDLLADADPAPQGQFTIQKDQVVAFTVGGRKAQLKEKPPLLGLRQAADLRAYSPTYGQGAKAYRPDGEAIAALRRSGKPVTVRVYFGSWCSFCKRYLPNLLRVEDELKGSKVKIEYFGLPHDMNDPEAKRLKVSGVPTGIVYVNGKEAGRITGNSWSTPETSLTTILGAAGGARGR